MLVPFISCEQRSVQFGTDAIAAPGALMHTPSEPSCLRQHKIQSTEILYIKIIRRLCSCNILMKSAWYQQFMEVVLYENESSIY